MFGEMKVGLGWWQEEQLPWVKDNDMWHELDEIGQSFATRKWCWDKYISLSKQTVGIQPKWMQRHAVAFSKGLPGAKKFVRLCMKCLLLKILLMLSASFLLVVANIETNI